METEAATRATWRLRRAGRSDRASCRVHLRCGCGCGCGGPSYIPDGGRNRLEGEIPRFLTCLTRSSVLPEHKFPWLTLLGANMTSDCFADNCRAGPIKGGATADSSKTATLIHLLFVTALGH